MNAVLAIPVVFAVETTFRTSTCDPILKVCGSSVVIFATFPAHSAPETNLKFLNSSAFERVTDVGEKYFWISVVPAPRTLFESWIIYPSTGAAPGVTVSFGTT